MENFPDLVEDVVGWRHDFHRYPELLYDVHRTSGKVKSLLQSFGCDEVLTGLGRTGVVGVINGRSGNCSRTIALRADMDALPIVETTGLNYASRDAGKMHACGHDGHTAMLLGASKFLTQNRDFNGRVVMIFQPAEEGGKGAQAMINDGLMTRFKIEEVYALHNMPGLPVGEFAIKTGPIMAASDRFDVTISGTGGHAGTPHATVDPIIVAAHLITALQSIVSRNIDPLCAAVVTIGAINSGETHNVIPDAATLLGTVRSLDEQTRQYCEKRVSEICNFVGLAFGARIELEYHVGHPVTWNHPEQTSHIAKAARRIVGQGAVNDKAAPFMGSEDFSFMLNERPGAYIFIGNGESARLHHPAYDFNDAAIPYGLRLWPELVGSRLGSDHAIV